MTYIKLFHSLWTRFGYWTLVIIIGIPPKKSKTKQQTNKPGPVVIIFKCDAKIMPNKPKGWCNKLTKQYTVISWLRGEQSNYCRPEVVEKIWETVARGRRPRATISQIFEFSITEGQWFDWIPSSFEITVLLPNCFKSPKHCQQYADPREIWRYVTLFVTWPVNSALLTGQ